MQHEVGERLVAQVPDVPRILSRMERAGWVQRVRSTDDRRVLRTTLAEKGLQLVNQLDEIIGGVHAGLFPAMSEEEMTNLSELLVLARRPRRDESA
jgi:DNA-binding MarR family transcriptional regulator